MFRSNLSILPIFLVPTMLQRWIILRLMIPRKWSRRVQRWIILRLNRGLMALIVLRLCPECPPPLG